MRIFKKLKITPPPWYIPHFADDPIDCECGYIFSEHLTIAEVYKEDDKTKDEYPKKENAIANAKLIIASPYNLFRDIRIGEIAREAQASGTVAVMIWALNKITELVDESLVESTGKPLKEITGKEKEK